MQVTKCAFFLVLGVAMQACGGGSDGDGGNDDDNGGGSTGNGGSSGKGGASSTGGSSGKGGASSTGGSTGTGGASGATATGGTTSTGGSTGVGGTAGAGGSVCLFDVPECEEFFTCIFDSVCAQAGAQQQACITAIKQGFQTSACYPAGTDLATACEMSKADPAIGMMYPQCQ